MRIMAWGYESDYWKKVVPNNIKWIQYTQWIFKQLNMLKIADQLRLQELKFYFKYIHKNLPGLFISNINHFHDTRTSIKSTPSELRIRQKMSEIQLITYYKRYPCNSGRKDTHTQPTRFRNICKTIPHTQIYRYMWLFVQSIIIIIIIFF